MKIFYLITKNTKTRFVNIKAKPVGNKPLQYKDFHHVKINLGMISMTWIMIMAHQMVRPFRQK